MRMDEIKVVSFDLEGTLTTPAFSHAVWYEGIPSLYAERHSIAFGEARMIVRQKYQEIGDRKKEWYDIKYWFTRFGLGDYHQVLDRYRDEVDRYPDALPILNALRNKYKLIIATNTAYEFLPYLLSGLESYFAGVFSSISDFGQLKTPQFYALVCRELGIEPREMAHVGDSWGFDYLPAKEAGIKAFHLDREQITEAGESLKSLSELETKLHCSENH
ncbi:MAG: HAD family hydrolase [Dehalococcoidales bacterium]|nr:HAD family hydrolase [Dehalococcoidales bacterium]